MVLTNDSETPRSYLIVLKHLPALADKAYIIETIGNADPMLIDVDWFKATERVKLSAVDGEVGFPVVVKPHSIMTITTLSERCTHMYGDEEITAESPDPAHIALPYVDAFDLPSDVMQKRGGMPQFTTDQGGAFEIISTGEGRFLEQKITKDALPTNWRFRGTPEPVTCFGDDTWSNYQASTEAIFADASPDNYVGAGIRYNSAVTCPETACCGLSVRLYADGRWELRYLDAVLQNGRIADFTFDKPHQIGIGALGTLVMCFADGHSLCEIKLDGRPLIRAGRASICSAYYRNRFRKLVVKKMPLPIPITTYVYRLDCLSEYVKFDENAENGWTLRGMAEYQHYNRTCAEGVPGSALDIRFYGEGIYLLGKTDYAECRIWLDGKLYSEKFVVNGSHYREAFLAIEPIRKAWHTLRIEVTDGKLCFDVFEVPTNDECCDYDTDFPADPLSAEPQPTRRKRERFDLKKAAVPLAGAAATGLAVAFTVGRFVRKLQKRRKK